MKRLHVHVAVDDLADSIRFYSSLFGADPSARQSDYAKWQLDDPRVNFAISARGRAAGVDHLGMQVETDSELREVAARLAAANRPVLEQKDANCWYARGDKAWSLDPQGVRWETFLTRDSITVYGEDSAAAAASGCSATPGAANPETRAARPEPKAAPCCGSAAR